MNEAQINHDETCMVTLSDEQVVHISQIPRDTRGIPVWSNANGTLTLRKIINKAFFGPASGVQDNKAGNESWLRFNIALKLEKKASYQNKIDNIDSYIEDAENKIHALHHEPTEKEKLELERQKVLKQLAKLDAKLSV